MTASPPVYQSDKSLIGQTTKNIPSMALIELSYKPIKNLPITGGIRCLFECMAIFYFVKGLQCSA